MLTAIKQIKERIENNLVAEMKNLFGEDTPVECEYSGEVLSARVHQSSPNVTISTTFVMVDGDDIYYNCVAYSKMVEGDEVVGVVPQGCQINFSTFSAVKEAFEKVLRQEEEGSEPDAEENDTPAAEE